MKVSSTEPEYSVEQPLERTILSTAQLKGSIRNYQEVEADLALLLQELNISVDILGRIRDSVRVLQLSLQEQE